VNRLCARFTPDGFRAGESMGLVRTLALPISRFPIPHCLFPLGSQSGDCSHSHFRFPIPYSLSPLGSQSGDCSHNYFRALPSALRATPRAAARSPSASSAAAAPGVAPAAAPAVPMKQLPPEDPPGTFRYLS
jgi:hypothetical protein